MASNKYVRYKKVMQSLTKAEIDMYKEIFNFFDYQKKKYLVADDFEHALRTMKQEPSPEEVQDLLETYDVNGDGKVTFEELVVVTVKRRKFTDEESELREAFRKFDKNGDGMLNRQELVEVITTLGTKLKWNNVDKILQRFDDNGDGVVQYAEFSKMILNEKYEDEGKDDQEEETDEQMKENTGNVTSQDSID